MNGNGYEYSLSRELLDQIRSAAQYLGANEVVEETGLIHWDHEGDAVECPEPNYTFQRKARFLAQELLKMFPVPEKDN